MMGFERCIVRLYNNVRKLKLTNLFDEIFICKIFAVRVQVGGDLLRRFTLLDMQIMCDSNHNVAEHLFFVVDRFERVFALAITMITHVLR